MAQFIEHKDELHKKGYTISIQHLKDSKALGEQDELICTGKKKWSFVLPNPMQGWGMYRTAYLLDISAHVFAVIQLYEHSRGGHTDPKISVFDYKGNLLWSFCHYGVDLEKAVIFDNKIWVLSAQYRLLNISTEEKMDGKAMILSSFEIKSGVVLHRLIKKSEIASFTDESSMGFYASFKEKRDRIVIVFRTRSNNVDEILKKRIDFEEFVRQLN